MHELNNTFIAVPTQELSEIVQRRFFELGVGWEEPYGMTVCSDPTDSHKEYACIVFEGNKIEYATRDYCISDLGYREITLHDLWNAKPVQDRWVPKVGEEFFYIGWGGDIKRSAWANDPSDNELLKFGDVFRTNEQAEKRRDEIRAGNIEFQRECWREETK